MVIKETEFFQQTQVFNPLFNVQRCFATYTGTIPCILLYEHKLYLTAAYSLQSDALDMKEECIFLQCFF
jgi:hypothetical protein